MDVGFNQNVGFAPPSKWLSGGFIARENLTVKTFVTHFQIWILNIHKTKVSCQIERLIVIIKTKLSKTQRIFVFTQLKLIDFIYMSAPNET